MNKIIFLISIIVCNLFLNIQIAFSIPENNQLDGIKVDDPEQNISTIKKNDSKTIKTDQDIFGDEQTFPFVAGLGKNAAH